MPKALRGLIERERDLHGLMARSGWEVLREALACAACEPEGLAGAVISLQTFGSYANFHRHPHAIVSEGVFARDGRFHPVIWPEGRTMPNARPDPTANAPPDGSGGYDVPSVPLLLSTPPRPALP